MNDQKKREDETAIKMTDQIRAQEDALMDKINQ